MTDDTADAVDAEERDGFESDAAAVFAVLAECWRRPTDSLVTAVNERKLEGILPGADDVSLDELRAEYTRLLLGPDPEQIPPYESVFRNRDEDGEYGSVNGPATEAVIKWYQSHGVAPAADEPELPDHIATELEFAAYLADNGELEACEQFLEEHPKQWFDEFLSEVRERTQSPFYESLTLATDKAIDIKLNGR
jgi:TorA maturation chaperone TorD